MSGHEQNSAKLIPVIFGSHLSCSLPIDLWRSLGFHSSTTIPRTTWPVHCHSYPNVTDHWDCLFLSFLRISLRCFEFSLISELGQCPRFISLSQNWGRSDRRLFYLSVFVCSTCGLKSSPHRFANWVWYDAIDFTLYVYFHVTIPLDVTNM